MRYEMGGNERSCEVAKMPMRMDEDGKAVEEMKTKKKADAVLQDSWPTRQTCIRLISRVL